MKKYLSLVKGHIGQGFMAKFVQIPMEENELANHLARAVSIEHMTVDSQVLSFIQYSPAIKELEVQVIPTRID